MVPRHMKAKHLEFMGKNNDTGQEPDALRTKLSSSLFSTSNQLGFPSGISFPSTPLLSYSYNLFLFLHSGITYLALNLRTYLCKNSTFFF